MCRLIYRPNDGEELNDALLRFGLHASKGTNAAVGGNVSLDGLGSGGSSSQRSGQPPYENRVLSLGVMDVVSVQLIVLGLA